MVTVRTFGSFNDIPNTDNWQGVDGSEVKSGSTVYFMSAPVFLDMRPEWLSAIRGVNMESFASVVAQKTGCKVVGLRVHYEEFSYGLDDYVFEAALQNETNNVKQANVLLDGVVDAMAQFLPQIQTFNAQMRIFNPNPNVPDPEPEPTIQSEPLVSKSNWLLYGVVGLILVGVGFILYKKRRK